MQPPPHHPFTPFCSNDLSTSSLSLSLSLPPPPFTCLSLSLSLSLSFSSLALPRVGFNAVLQFQPHFCASLSLWANSDNMSRPYQTAVLISESIFFQAIQSFSQEPARCTASLYDHAQKSVRTVAIQRISTRRAASSFCLFLSLFLFLHRSLL